MARAESWQVLPRYTRQNDNLNLQSLENGHKKTARLYRTALFKPKTKFMK
jgi:hypothetical protein